MKQIPIYDALDQRDVLVWGKSIDRKCGSCRIWFDCKTCKNLVLGDDSGTWYDCNRCNIIEHENKLYCANFNEERET